MPTLADNSADKSWEALWTLGQADQHALVDYAFELQAEVRRLRDAAAQNSHNRSRPRSEEHTSELQSRQYLPFFPTRRSSVLSTRPARFGRLCLRPPGRGASAARPRRSKQPQQFAS